MSEVKATVGVIGGSGLYDMDGLEGVQEVYPKTPFGKPSDAIVVGSLDGVDVAFLPRHGRGHRLTPSEVPSRANIYALRMLGVKQIVSVSAVGSLKEEIRPLDLVVPDQLIDRTRLRQNTFFGDGIVAHVSFAEPFCPWLSSLTAKAAATGARVHRGGTYVVIEGPAFSTKAESHLYRSWGASVIGMTALPEARLAREAEMCYTTLACATDYDVWHETEAPVTVEMVVANLQRNVATARSILQALMPRLGESHLCSCGMALKDAIITSPDRITAEAKERLAVIIGKYVR